MLELKIRRVGSSLGVLLPKKALDEAGIGEGDTIRMPALAKPVAFDFYGIWKDRPVRLQADDQ